MQGVVYSAYPDMVLFTTDSEWITAGSSNRSSITAIVLNGSEPMQGLSVDFTLNDPSMGSFSASPVVTNINGEALTSFSPSITSGNADLIATIYYYEDGNPKERLAYLTQKIDHASPYRISDIVYDSEVQVGTGTNISIWFEDVYANPVDNLNVAEEIRLVAGSPSGNGGFLNGSEIQSDITVSVDGDGRESSFYVADTVPGENLVWVDPPGSIPEMYIYISGVAEAPPYSIISSVSPYAEPLPYQPADGQSLFKFVYTLLDKYGNPSGNRDIMINTSIPGESQLLRTNSYGKVYVTYGPKEVARTISITVVSVDNESVSITDQVEFVHTAPVNMVLTASPATMASRDVKEDLTALVKAKVVDTKGNPVEGETVSFSLSGWTLDGSFNQTVGPLIDSDLAVTDEDGYATTIFRPGAFTVDPLSPLYSDMASGSAIVEATWENETNYVNIEYRNYPYLSIETSVSPETVTVNDTVMLNIRLIGDGWALQPRPIDVVLCTDRSGSMLLNTTSDPSRSSYDPLKYVSESEDDRMVHAMEAAEDFVSEMNQNRDRIGLSSFGNSGYSDLDSYSSRYWRGNDYVYRQIYYSIWRWGADYSDDGDYQLSHYNNPQTYASYGTRDLELTFEYTDVNEIIGNWLPMGGTPMREGLYRAIRMHIENPRAGGDSPVKAIVLLTDGAWNIGGDPDGGSGADSFTGVGTGSMIDYAADNGIRIYTIALGTDPDAAALSSYADLTGGISYSAADGDDLSGIYEDIASELREAAGVNTQMTLDLGAVFVNNASVPGSEVIDYTPYTEIISYNETHTILEDTIDQTEDWNGSPPPAQSLAFEVGTIKLDQVWEADIKFTVLGYGNIRLLDNSIVEFNNGTESVTLPPVYISSYPNLTDIGFDSSLLDIYDLRSLSGESTSDFLDIAWNLDYGGEMTVTENIYHSGDGGLSWTFVSSKTADNSIYYDQATIDVRDLPMGDYLVKVKVSAEDAPDDYDIITEEIYVGTGQKAYIKIE